MRAAKGDAAEVPGRVERRSTRLDRPISKKAMRCAAHGGIVGRSERPGQEHSKRSFKIILKSYLKKTYL